MGKTKIPVIIDRIEDGFVTVAMTMPEAVLPPNARTGDVIFYDEESGSFQVDVEETRKRRKNSFELFEGLRDKKNP